MGGKEQKQYLAINLHEFEHNSNFIDNVYVFFSSSSFFSLFALLMIVYLCFAGNEQSDLLC